MDYASNPKATFDYDILETIEAGLVLAGYEVKSIKTGKVSLKGAYVKVLNGQAVLVGATVSPYQPKNTPPDYDPQRTRTLLLTAKQIASLIGLSQSHGLTLVPLKLYDKRGKVKLLVGVARGKKKYDKRETLRKKDVQRAKERGYDEA